MFKKIFSYVAKSVYNKDGKVSTARVSSYFILVGINLSTFVFLGIDVVNAINHWKLGTDYTIPSAHIGIFALVLSHHLVLAGISKVSEVKTTVATPADHPLTPTAAPTPSSVVNQPIQDNTIGLVD